ncbi:MAG: hypothetical protein ISQ34_00360 [Rickettsiales bacterium]|nr:hypothetical protein [Rickettsiales bacterium]
MIDRKISVHLQDYPDVSYFDDETELVSNMDLVRNICSTALSIRDNKNLRVRLPLASLKIIGQNASRILQFKDIIADEVNVKSVKTEEDFSELAELKLQVNFKKIGAKHGPKIKDIIAATKQGNWQKNDQGQIEVCDVTLEKDEFEIKLEPKNQGEEKHASLALPTNDYLVRLDIEVTKELEDEGIARDIIRAIQQNRKAADLDISDKINITLFSEENRAIEVAKSFESYIKEQVLANNIEYASKSPEKTDKYFENKLENSDLIVVIN